MPEQTVIIKRVDDDGHDDHHGGGWKVAYADFMTAMMAFFLLLWILAASDEEKLRGLADYFTPSLSEAGGRGEGILAGQVLAEDGILSGTDGPRSEVQLPSFGQENPLAVFDSRIRYDERHAAAASPVEGGANGEEGGLSDDQASLETLNGATSNGTDGAEASELEGTDRERLNQQEIEAGFAELLEKEKARVEALEAVQAEVQAALAKEPNLSGFAENLRFELSEEGLEIQIVTMKGARCLQWAVRKSKAAPVSSSTSLRRRSRHPIGPWRSRVIRTRCPMQAVRATRTGNFRRIAPTRPAARSLREA